MLPQTPPRYLPSNHLKKDQDSETRYPSTDHKLFCSPPVFRRSNPRLYPPELLNQNYPSLPEKIIQLQRRKNRYMRSRQYDKAERIDRSVKKAKSMLASLRLKQVIESQKEERRSVSQAHRHQMLYFQSQWSEYFQKLKEREMLILQSFQKEQRKEMIDSQVRIRRRCRSLSSSSRAIEQLREKQKMLRRTSDFDNLKQVKMMLAETLIRERRKRAQTIERFQQIEQERLTVAYSKKYAVLMRRLEEYRGDKERVYLREQKRLKQKYKNVLQQLRHDHCLQLEKTSKLALIIK